MTIHFEVKSEVDILSYAVEKSYDQNSWTTLKTVYPLGQLLYDFRVPIGSGYYRIKVNNKNGPIYSKVITVN